jgi:hypothetical protein
MKLKRRLDDREAIKAREMYEQGASTYAVARHFEASQGYIYTVLVECGTKMRPAGRGHATKCKYTGCDRPLYKFLHTTNTGTWNVGNTCRLHFLLDRAKRARERMRRLTDIPPHKWVYTMDIADPELRREVEDFYEARHQLALLRRRSRGRRGEANGNP